MTILTGIYSVHLCSICVNYSTVYWGTFFGQSGTIHLEQFVNRNNALCAQIYANTADVDLV